MRSRDNKMYEIIKEVIVNASAEGADIEWSGDCTTEEVIEWLNDKLEQS